jgi:hypothetical protein
MFADDAGTTIKTTIAVDASSKRGHPHLYRQLRRLLDDEGHWPDEL